jgi:hypothetical protein
MFEFAVMQSEFKRLPAGRIAEQSDRRRPAACRGRPRDFD